MKVVYKFDELVKLDKSLKAFETLREIYESIIDFFTQKTVGVKEVWKNEINLEIKTISIN